MSDFYKPTYYTKNANQKQLLNTLVGNHDLICGCEEPLTHIGCLIFEKARPTNIPPKYKKIIKKCLGEEDGDGAALTNGDDTPIDAGDLEKLFGEDDSTEK